VYLTKGSSTGDACKYGAKIMACLRRYSVNALPAQRPCDWITSKGTPRSRYSKVPPIRRLWPLRFGRLNRFASLLILLVNSFLLRGRRLPLECVQENRCSFGATELMRKWLSRAAIGSAGPFCWAHLRCS